MTAHAQIKRLIDQLNTVLIGQSVVVERMVIALLCDGHILLEGLPGTAKTRAVSMFAQALDASLGRVQFTPDLLPSDITGTEAYLHEQHAEKLVFQPGPIFNNIVLADEINRAPAKVQAALLEAMAERQVTVVGKTYPLPSPFMVLATQNPIEQDGTYPLPEAQLDRFLMKLNVRYPSADEELAIIRLVRGEEQAAGTALEPISAQSITDARHALSKIYVAEALEQYIVALVMATREPRRVSAEFAAWVAVGASPRASIALDRCARCHAWLQARDYVSPEDVQAVVADVLRHRLHLSYEAIAEGVTSEQLIDALLAAVPVV